MGRSMENKSPWRGGNGRNWGQWAWRRGGLQERMHILRTPEMGTTSELQSWEGPYGSTSSAPVKEYSGELNSRPLAPQQSRQIGECKESASPGHWVRWGYRRAGFSCTSAKASGWLVWVRHWCQLSRVVDMFCSRGLQAEVGHLSFRDSWALHVLHWAGQQKWMGSTKLSPAWWFDGWNPHISYKQSKLHYVNGPTQVITYYWILANMLLLNPDKTWGKLRPSLSCQLPKWVTVLRTTDSEYYANTVP